MSMESQVCNSHPEQCNTACPELPFASNCIILNRRVSQATHPFKRCDVQFLFLILSIEPITHQILNNVPRSSAAPSLTSKNTIKITLLQTISNRETDKVYFHSLFPSIPYLIPPLPSMPIRDLSPTFNTQPRSSRTRETYNSIFGLAKSEPSPRPRRTPLPLFGPQGSEYSSIADPCENYPEAKVSNAIASPKS